MNDRKEESQSADNAGKSTGPAPLSRRTLLRAGATAMPVVLTLQSGAALARTSNLIGASPPPTDGSDVLCLNVTNAPTYGTKYDLGDWESDYTRLRTDVSYHPLISGGRSNDMGITAQQFCDAGGSYEFKDGGWCTVDLPRNNIVVSSIALNSVGGRIRISDNTRIC